MTVRTIASTAVLVLGLALVTLQAAAVSRQQADSFAKKIAIIQQQGAGGGPRAGLSRRTPVTEAEVNSWFTYRATSLLPKGITAPQITLVGDGKVTGLATVDLETIGRAKATGGLLDPWSLLGGQVPVTVTGILRASGGRGRFEVQDAAIGGIPVPPAILQDLLSRYSRTESRPDGVRLDTPFELPARITAIELGAGQAVVVQ